MTNGTTYFREGNAESEGDDPHTTRRDDADGHSQLRHHVPPRRFQDHVWIT
jgi:hypothetical protein